MATQVTKTGLYGVKGPVGLNGTKGWYVSKEEEKQQKNMKEIIDALSDAILATGKPFKDIPKSSITDYLTKVGVNRSKHEEIYQKLTEIYKTKNKATTNGDFFTGSTGATSSSTTSSPATKVAPAVTAKTKERQPRKNVFSEITKIH
jgi:hypothetical protein